MTSGNIQEDKEDPLGFSLKIQEVGMPVLEGTLNSRKHTSHLFVIYGKEGIWILLPSELTVTPVSDDNKRI